MEFIRKMAEKFLKLHNVLRRRYKAVVAMAAAVVFITTYALILPAVTLDTSTAAAEAGIEVAAPEEENAGGSSSSEEKASEAKSEEKAESEDKADTKEEAKDEANSEEASSEKTTSEKAASEATTEEQKLITEDTTLSYDGDGYTVKAEVTADAKLPVGTKLKIKKISKDDSDYQTYFDKALKKVQEKDSDIDTLSTAKFYDISFENDDKEVKPESKVKFTFTYDDAIEIKDGGSVKVVYYNDDNNAQILGDDNSVDTHVSDNKTSKVEFKASASAVYGIVGSEKGTEEDLTYPEKDKTFTASVAGYSISVDVLAKSFAKEVNLKADTQDWDDLSSDVQKKLEAQGVDKDSSQSLDLRFEDADGNEVEPANKVAVKFTIDDKDVVKAANNEDGSVTIYNAEETKDDNGDVKDIEVKQVASTTDDSVVAQKTKATAEFDTEKFSTFTITYTTGSGRNAESHTLGIHIVDTSGNEIGENASINVPQNTSIDTVQQQANPNSATYTFAGAKVGTSFATATDVASNNIFHYYSAYGWTINSATNTNTPINNGYLTYSNYNVYFIYQNPDSSVTITYNLNGGTGTTPESQSGKVGDTITLSDEVPTREGYTFMGWTNTADLSADDQYHAVYPSGSEYTLPNSDTTLYAAWANNATSSYRTSYFYLRLDGKIPTEPSNYEARAYTSGIAVSGNIKSERWIIDTSWRSIDGANALNNVTDNLVRLPTVDELVNNINNSSSSLGFRVQNQNGRIVVSEITDTSVNNAGYGVSVGNELYAQWYVQKLQNISETSDNKIGRWHIDGVLLVKDKVTITYVKNTEDVVNNMPIGYQADKPTDVTIGASAGPNGTVLTPTRAGWNFLGWNTQADGSGTWYYNNDNYTLDHDTILYAQWSRGYNHLTVNKKDEDGNVLAGATFTLEEKDGSTWTQVSSGTTSDAGTYTYNNVRSQTIYRLTESHAPNGYLTRNSFCFEVTTGNNQEILNIFVVDEDGNKIDTPSWLKTTYTQASVSGGSGSISMNITDEAIKRNVVFVKTAADGTTKLSGAKFSLTKNNATVSGVLKDESDSNGVFSVDDATLTYGTYTLTETKAPTGYQKADPVTLTLNDYKSDDDIGMTVTGNAAVTCESKTSTENDTVTTTYTYTVTVKDTPKTDVTVIKTDDKTPATHLSGVTFKLTKQTGSGDSTTWEAVNIDNVTNGEGSFTISENQKETGVTLTGLDNGTYKLTETKAPDGYIVQTSDTIFTVGADGKVTLDDGQSQATLETTDGNTLSIKNTAGVALPNTGGSGTTMYTLGGLTLIIASALMYGFVLRRNKRERRFK